MVAAAQTRSSPLADSKEGQAALFALSRGRKEGEVEGDESPLQEELFPESVWVWLFSAGVSWHARGCPLQGAG